MRAWASNAMGSVVWRKVFNDHPSLLEVFSPGNEEMLSVARQQHEKLESAIQRFGLPPQELLQELLTGEKNETNSNNTGGRIRDFFSGVGSGGGLLNHLTSGRMQCNDSFALKHEEFQQFFAEGYLRVNDVVPLEVIDIALRHINSSIGRGGVDRSIPTLINLDGAGVRSNYLLDLFDTRKGSKLPTIVQCLCGKGKIHPPEACQVAMKFPSPNNGIPRNTSNFSGIKGTGWHIDGFGQGKHSPFTLLVGICLSDILVENSGEFAVHPGTHWGLQDLIKTQVEQNNAGDLSKFEAENKPNLGPPIRMMLKKGDAVICHQKLPHLGMPNYSPNIRYQIYFRVSHIQLSQHRNEWLDDLLLPYEGLKQAMS